MQNKQYLFFIIPALIFYIVLGFGVLSSNAYAQDICNDTDNGDYYTQGTCTDTVFGSSGAGPDRCTFDGDLIEITCLPTSDNCFPEIITCPDGNACVDGACPKPVGLVPDCGDIGNPCTFKHFFELLHNVLDFVIFTLAPLLVILFIALGGFFMMISRGNPSQFSRGKSMVVWALIGYGIILISWVVVNTILTSIGVASWVGILSWWEITF
jgi:hypothetical protein